MGNPRTARTQFVLPASQIEFLDRFCTRVRRDTGSRVSKRAVIESLVESIPIEKISLREVTSEVHLKEILRGQGGPTAATLMPEAAVDEPGNDDCDQVTECPIETNP